MLSVLESIKLSTEYLEKKGIESPRLNAELLLASILNCKRFDLYVMFDQPLKNEEIDKYREWIARRGKFEPLQYITGNVEFYGLNFKVTPAVLIPRPETEILIETIVEHYSDKPELKILDVGTGSGNIAVSLAKHLQNSIVSSVDISEEILEIAKQNAANNSVDSIEFINGNILTGEGLNGSNFDIIVSNPPYVSKDEFPSLQKEIIDYEPRHAVTDEGNGINFYEKISSFAKERLNTGGKIFYELGKDQHIIVEGILNDNGFKNIRIKKDFQNVERVIYGTKL